jgi:hypothetical protein
LGSLAETRAQQVPVLTGPCQGSDPTGMTNPSGPGTGRRASPGPLPRAPNSGRGNAPASATGRGPALSDARSDSRRQAPRSRPPTGSISP